MIARVHDILAVIGGVAVGTALLVVIAVFIAHLRDAFDRQARERQRFRDVDDLARASKVTANLPVRQARVSANVPATDDEHAEHLGAA